MIGQIIKRLREERKLTQAELAERVGINISTLASYERETREPNIEKICLFADFFGVTIDYLLGMSTQQIPDMSVKSVSNMTGLSENAVLTLCALKKYHTRYSDEKIIDAISFLIEQDPPPPLSNDFIYFSSEKPVELLTDKESFFNEKAYQEAYKEWHENYAHVLRRIEKILFYEPSPATVASLISRHEVTESEAQHDLQDFELHVLLSVALEAIQKLKRIRDADRGC